MENKIIAIDQSTSATKAMLFSENCELMRRVNISHQQYYPKAGWVEHDAEEIYQNVLLAVAQLMEEEQPEENCLYSLALTNQRETVVVWDKNTGKPVYNAIVWQCQRGAAFCRELKDKGYTQMIREKTGLMPDPYFSASGVKWILDNVKGARESAGKGDLLMGTIDSWLIWNLTAGEKHLTDYTNASRTLLFNIQNLDWDEELLELFTIPRTMMPRALPCDSVFGETTMGALFQTPVVIAGVLGDSHGALTGQRCFEKGLGKATYGTGSSVMVNIGEEALAPPEGLVTSIGLSALGKVYYAFEGNIHCTGATISWIEKKLEMIGSPEEIEAWAGSAEDNEGVYWVPAFTGLGAPWWNPEVRAAILGISLGVGKAHILRAALESIAYQVKDLLNVMIRQAGITLKELRADGGPVKNKLLMQFQADQLRVPVNCLDMEEASALGAVIMNGFARKRWNSFQEIPALRGSKYLLLPIADEEKMDSLYRGWLKAVEQLIK
ncbi:MAG: glycerol kinase GlpK [Tannerellaceae bacterium]|jgi:glycerol kinase|nr:glycerol kinase GlpK [Tannerellaceae bacterium]